MIVVAGWVFVGADVMSGKSLEEQSQMFHVGVGTIKGLALLISIVGWLPGR